MSRSRKPILRVSAVILVAAFVFAGCGGDQSSDAEVVARAAPDPNAPADTASGTGSDADAPAPDATIAAVTTPNPDASGPASSGAGIVVDVAGAVRHPGVYRMPPGARVHEAIQAAGGARRGAALGSLNRAAVLLDGQQVLVGDADASVGAGVGAGTTAGGAGAGAGAAAGGAKVNLNSADAAALDALPGIGQVTAEHIITSRQEAGPFATIDDLDRVPGIGPTTIESLRAVATT
ncbi:MAG: DNA-binding protein [Thermoleophilia bacterium]|nr:DNA-binding protein [Thermoleophilia bacterium]